MAVSEASRQVRGSTTLLLGRSVSLVVNLGLKVVIVRWLTKAEFGAFAYGFAMVPVVRTLVALGQTQAISRFLSLYEEDGDHERLVGTVVTVVGMVVGLGGIVLLGIALLRDTLLLDLVGDPRAVAALVIVAALGPLDALDKTWEGVLAVLASPLEIFVRRYVVGPAFLVVAVVTALATGGGAIRLAWAYVLAALFTTLVSSGLAIRSMRRRGILRAVRGSRLVFPFRELYGFSSPLVLTELLPIAMGPVAVALLGYVGTTADVASYRSVYPLARFNQTVLFTFTILYVPLAARMFARRDRLGASQAYWQTASWLLLLSLPALVATISFAEPVTVLLFGEAYRSSAPLLMVLSLGYLLNVSTGFNAQTLQVQGHVGQLVLASVVAAATTVAALVLLTPPLGAMGVAIGVAIGLATQNLLNHVGLVRRTGIPGCTRAYARLAATVAVVLVALLAVQQLVRPSVWVALAIGAVVCVAVLAAFRRDLQIADTFPELARVPVLRWFVG